MPKIVIVGAGSLGFSSKLTIDILSYPAFAKAHFALVDIDAKRLGYAERIVQRIFRDGGYPDASYSTHANYEDALDGADYVITSILVGGYEAIKSEADIPLKYGVDQCIGDTLTPGGIMRCMRTLPILGKLAQDVMRICPEAVVLNYTNPMSMLCWGMTRMAPGIKLVGLCHSVQGTSKEWANRLDIDINDVNYECSGINHQAWFTRFEKDGEDLLPKIREIAEKPEVWLGDTVRMEMVKHFGFPVTESSGHGSEYTPWWRKRPELIEKYCPNGSWNGGSLFVKELYERPDWEERMERRATTEELKFERSLEYGSQIVNACESGESVIIYGNVMNNGLIPNLPSDSCVEVPIHVDKNGLQPIQVKALPTHLASINRNQINVQELAVEAAMEADPEKLFQAMCMDPLTGAVLTLDEIRAMTSELLEAHRFCLPTFEGKSLAAKPVLVGSSAENVEVHVDPAEEDEEALVEA